LSFTTTTTLRSRPAAMLFSASQAMPPVSAPSPTTATTWRCCPVRAYALASPSAHDREVDAWLFSTWSCSLSARLG
jgi:hypothetical protein